MAFVCQPITNNNIDSQILERGIGCQDTMLVCCDCEEMIVDSEIKDSYICVPVP